MILAVTGSRHWKDRTAMEKALDAAHAWNPVTTLIHGGAEGADRLAAVWATERGIASLTYLPQYEQYGRRAPLERNSELVMAAHGVIAFRSSGKSNGTDDTIRKAKKAGKLLRVVKEE